MLNYKRYKAFPAFRYPAVSRENVGGQGHYEGTDLVLCGSS